ncbi:ABC transporter permease subunit [Blastococcus sp. TML/C7B]|uniref:ABC transporter permease subunit n=1 Tax=Blastococcus sp. TML/C7B TaxID=2798728 RepID=UPI001F5B8850|nr:ABC transporter permease subunit [Blastococcus sp. TML/C7B]
MHRFRSRRFIQVVLALAVVGWLAATGIALTQYGTPTADEIARAEQQIDADVAMNEEFRQECLADAELPAGTSPEDFCGPEQSRDDYDLSWYLDTAPFDLAASGTTGALGFAALASVVVALVGATWIGAEWSTRSLVALLFWVPRRMQVMAAKVVVLTGAAAVIGVLAQAGWLAMAGTLHALVGRDAALPAGFWGDLLQTQARGVLLTVLAALLAFGLTNLVRNTGAALGVAFVYLVVVESAVRGLRPLWQPWLLSNNAVALVEQGGSTLYVYDESRPDVDGVLQPVEYYLGHLQSGLLLGAVTAVVLVLGAVLFARRDLQ